MSVSFYIRDSQGNEDGPHSVDVLTQQLGNGTLTRFSSIRREDQKRWRTLGSFTEFARAKTGLEVQMSLSTAKPVPPEEPGGAVPPGVPSSPLVPPPVSPLSSVKSKNTAPATPRGARPFSQPPRPEPAPPAPSRSATEEPPPQLRSPTPFPPDPDPLPIFDPMERQRRRKEEDEEPKPKSLPQWMWRTWGIMVVLRFFLWLNDGSSGLMSVGKLIPLPFHLFIFPLFASRFVLKKTSGDCDKAAIAFLSTYLFLWVLSW
jgi:hypothetical protein